MTAQKEGEREPKGRSVCDLLVQFDADDRLCGCGRAQNSQNSKKIHWPTYPVLWLAQRRKVGTATRLAINAFNALCTAPTACMGWRRLGRASGRNE